MAHLEHKFQSAAHVFLSRALPDALHWGVDHAGARSPMQGAWMKQRGIMAGIPDHFTLHRGVLIGWEWKAGKGTTSERQDAFAVRMMNNDAYYFVCRTIDEIEQALRLFGWDLRASAGGIDAKLAAHVPSRATKPRTAKPSTRQIAKAEALRARYLPT